MENLSNNINQEEINEIKVNEPIVLSSTESPKNHQKEIAYEIEDIIAMRNEIIKLQEEAVITNKKLRLAKQTLVYVNAWIVPDNVRRTVELTLKSLSKRK